VAGDRVSAFQEGIARLKTDEIACSLSEIAVKIQTDGGIVLERSDATVSAAIYGFIT
jgi:hypothetical protein